MCHFPPLNKRKDIFEILWIFTILLASNTFIWIMHGQIRLALYFYRVFKTAWWYITSVVVRAFRNLLMYLTVYCNNSTMLPKVVKLQIFLFKSKKIFVNKHRSTVTSVNRVLYQRVYQLYVSAVDKNRDWFFLHKTKVT